MKPFLSIIVPVFNESRRIHNLAIVSDFLESQSFTGELVVVNDGSTDDTRQRLDSLSLPPESKLVSYGQNRGKGYAIKKGMLEAQGNYRLFTDIDLSTPLEEFNKFLPHLDRYDIVMGSRRIEGAQVLRHQGKVRESLGKGFTFLSNRMLELSTSDFTCGFKCFSRATSEKIFPRMTIHGWGFDSEILYIAKKQGLSIKEIPVTWENDPHTKVRFPRDLVRSFSDLVQIRLNDLRKTYD